MRAESSIGFTDVQHKHLNRCSGEVRLAGAVLGYDVPFPSALPLRFFPYAQVGHDVKFEFSPSTSKVDIDALVVRYADPTYWHQAIQAEAESNLG